MSLTLPSLPEATRLHPSTPEIPFLEDLPALRREWLSLKREADPELKAEGLFSLARRLESRGAGEAAARLYQDLAGSESPAGERARAALEALQGRGDFGARTETYLRHFTQQVTDPAALLAMGVAGSVFRVVRLGALTRFQSAGFSGGMARFGAALAGLGLEAPAFALSAKTGSELLGRPQDWSLAALGRDTAAGYLTLAGLRGGGGLARAGLRALPASLQASPLSRALLGQGGLLGGILLAHSLEASAGLRPGQSAGAALFEGLGTLLHFQVAGRLSRAAFGRNFAAWERGMDLQSEALASQNIRPRSRLDGSGGGFGSFGMAEAFAGIGSGAIPRGTSRPLFSNVVQMSGKAEDGRPPASSQSGTRPAYAAETPSFREAEIFLEGTASPEASLRAFLNELPVPAIAARIKGEDGLLRIVAANSDFISHFGHSERELAQHPLTHYLSIKSAPVVASRLWTMVRGGVFNAALVDFQGRRTLEKVWMSGVVRQVHGQSYAFAFYQPRQANQAEQPAVPAMLKAFQSADGNRALDPDAFGFLELRSALELSLQLTNRDSPLLNHLRRNDLQLRIVGVEAAPIRSLATALERNLSHWAQVLNIPIGRSLYIEQAAGPKEGGSLQLAHSGFGFTLSEGRTSSPSDITQPIATPITPPTPAVDRSSIIQTRGRGQVGGLYERVQKALAGIGPGEDNGGDGKTPRK